MSALNRVLGPAARRGLSWLSSRRLPKTAGEIPAQGLEAPVEVLRDRWGIPHIYAADFCDLFFAQAFVHAQDRLWQMELLRRTALGRLSEVFGEATLEVDCFARTLGFRRLGNSDWGQASAEMRRILLSYAIGINAFLENSTSRLPLEFALLNHQPEPWSTEDITAIARLVIWQLSHAWYGEIVRGMLVAAVGPERAAELEINYPSTNPATLPKGIEFNSLDPDGRLYRLPGPFLQQGAGSNAWSLSSRRSAEGHTYLCNDMHLSLTLPNLWYEIHLSAPELEISGVSIPGTPLVLVGHNDRIAWGMTLAYTDAEDLFVEQFHPENPARYRYRDSWLEAETIREQIHIRRRVEPEQHTVQITRHGPIISHVDGDPHQKLALQSAALQPALNMLQGWWQLNRAREWDDFVQAVRLIEAPQLNIVYADVQGNTGYWVSGRVPLRSQGDGRLPSPGWSGDYEWVGFVPFEAMPHALNPEQGYIVTANNRVVNDDYPHYLGEVWMNGYRARRLVEMIESKTRLTFDDLRRMQTDFTCLPGRELAARLEEFDSPDPQVRLALDLLRLWDGSLDAGSVPGAIYQVLRWRLVSNLLEPALDPELVLRVRGQGPHPVLYPGSEFYGHDTSLIFRMLDNPDTWWLKQTGGKDAWLERSFRETLDWLRRELGPSPQDWQWGRLHSLTFTGALSQQPPLDQVFDRGPYPVGGDTDTPWQMAMLPQQPFGSPAWGPIVRFIFDLNDLSRSVAVLSTGQSGHVGSPHYDDQIPLWLNGEYHPMLWTRSQVEAELEARLVIKPGVQ